MDEIYKTVVTLAMLAPFVASETLSPLVEHRRHDAITLAPFRPTYAVPPWSSDPPDDAPEGGHSPIPVVARTATIYSTSSDASYVLRIDPARRS
jgi:hypothetical protein